MEFFQKLIDGANGITEKSMNADAARNASNQRIANFLADREKQDKVKKVLIDLVEQTKYLTKQDVGKWRRAWQRAISKEWPSRYDLHAVYRDIAIDNHILAVIGQIKKEVLQKEIVVVDRTDKETEIDGLAATLDDAQWFLDFCGFVIDSEFWGYQLAQFGDVVVDETGTRKFTECELIDPDHVVPEYHVFIKHVTDNYKNGIDYTLPPYNSMVIGVGNKCNLGLYNALAPHAIAKKNMLAFWDKFGEIFGMPIRIGKTSSTNPADRNSVSDMLQKMGSAAWGMFPEGTEIEIKETTRGDAWMVYDKRIERANSEMSKAVLHQTMTTDNGSSKSQSETHLEIQEKVIEYFARLVRININDKLIPFMIMHGFKGWEKARVKFDDTVEYTIDEQVKVWDMILNHYDVDAAEVEKTFNIPVIVKKQTSPTPPPNPGNFFD